MLKSLSIRNIALIDRADLSFSEGLNVLSGETGAGKSVILESIDFALGAKADKSMIRYGADECTVRAEFSCGDEEVRALLEEFDIEAEDDAIVLSRRFTKDGRGSAKINGCAVTSAMLKRLTALLADVHGQSEHFLLLKESNQLKLLDKVAGAEVSARKQAVREQLAKKRSVEEKLSLLGGDEGERSRRLDILRYQIGELERADVREGEEERLLSLREKFRNAEKILGGLNAARESLLSDGGAADTAGAAARALSSISRYGDYGDLSDRLESVLSELNDVGETLSDLAEELDVDEEERERVENRLDEIKAMKRKYGGSVKEMEAFLARAREEYTLLEDSGARFAELTKELGEAERGLYAACLSLTEARKRAAAAFAASVEEELRSLNISSARFEVQFDGYTEADVGKATSEGLGGIRFLFSANAGEPLGELSKIISGGEMSRLMLAVKARASRYGAGTYIFDEIDAGIGGKTAIAVAEKFVKISKSVQIIAVSHLAQIAAAADRQFLIEKTEAGEKTFTRVKELSEEERRTELSRLLSGEESELALRHADELLASAKAYKNSL